MTRSKRMFVYTEDAPVRRDVDARGLNRAGTTTLRCIGDHLDGIAICPAWQWFPRRDLDPTLSPLCVGLPRSTTWAYKALRRYPALDVGISERLPSWLLASRVRRSPADLLFAFVGADLRTVDRAARLARSAGKAYSLYLVDDFLLPLRLAGAAEGTIRKAADRVRRALADASHVFTITAALGESVLSTYGVPATTLPLAFEPEDRPSAPASDTIIYVGNVNFLYAEGLRQLFDIVGRVRAETGIDLKVRLTVPRRVAIAEIGDLPPFAVTEPAGSSRLLAREIASSLFAFLPYSFAAEHRPMVSTSFPSKSLEYLAFAGSIVAYGPEYGTATRSFREANLPSVASSPIELEQQVRAHLSERPEHSPRYREYLSATHAPTAVRRILCAALGLEDAS